MKTQNGTMSYELRASSQKSRKRQKSQKTKFRPSSTRPSSSVPPKARMLKK